MPEKRDNYAGDPTMPTRAEIERLTRLLEEFDRRSSASTTVPPEVETAIAAVSVALKSLENALALQESPIQVTSIDPTSGPEGGMQEVTIVGASILPGTTVTFDDKPARDVQIISPTLIKAKTPPHAEVPVTVIVSTLAGAAALSGKYTYFKTPQTAR